MSHAGDLSLHFIFVLILALIISQIFKDSFFKFCTGTLCTLFVARQIWIPVKLKLVVLQKISGHMINNKKVQLASKHFLSTVLVAHLSELNLVMWSTTAVTV